MTKSKKSMVVIVAVLMVVEISAAFETSMIYAAIARLVREFGDPITVGWLITIYLLMGAGTSAVMSRLGDIYGRRKCVLILLCAGLIGSIMSATSDTFAFILIGRGMQGLTAAILPLCIGLVRELIDARHVSTCVGFLISAAGIGTISGLLIGGLLIDNFAWQSIFVTSAIMMMISILVVITFLPKSVVKVLPQKLDIAGGILFMSGISLFLLSISNGNNWGWSSPKFAGLIIASLGLLIVWAFHSLKIPEPLINIRLLANPTVLIANVSMALIALGSLQITQVFSLLLQQPLWTGVGIGISATAAGLVKLPSNFFSLAGGPLSGYLLSKIGPRQTVTISATLCAMGWAFAWFFHGSVIEVGAALVLISFGTTMVYASLPNLVATSVDVSRTSEAAGFNMVIRSTFMAIGAQMVAVLLASETVNELANQNMRFPSEGAYLLTMATICALCIAVAVLSRLLPKSHTL